MTMALEGGEGSVSRPSRSIPLGKTRYPLYRRLGGPQARSGQARKISPPPGFDPWTTQLIASPYTDYATWPTYLWQLVLQTGILFFLKMVHLYQNMIEIRLSYSYIADILHLVGDIKLSAFNNLLNQTINNIQMQTKLCTAPTVLV